MSNSHRPWDATGAHESIGDDVEKSVAIRTIRKLIEFWKIELSELEGPLPSVPRRHPSVPMRPKVAYRHPLHGAFWNGVGAQPDWLRSALLKEGYTVEELRVADPGNMSGES